jgi:hypothetical protein
MDFMEVLSEEAFQFTVVLVGLAKLCACRKQYVFTRGTATFGRYAAYVPTDH